MRVIKTYSKQIELAEKGLLFCIVNCAYLRVSAEHVKIAKETNQSVKFYAKTWQVLTMPLNLAVVAWQAYRIAYNSYQSSKKAYPDDPGVR